MPQRRVWCLVQLLRQLRVSGQPLPLHLSLRLLVASLGPLLLLMLLRGSGGVESYVLLDLDLALAVKSYDCTWTGFRPAPPCIP